MATNPYGTPNTGSEQGDPSEPKSGQETPPNDSNIDSKTCANGMEELYLCDSKTEETTLASSPCVSDSLHPHMNTEFLKKAEENLLQATLLSLDLSKEDIDFILEQGDKFLEKPPLLLARKLGIDVDTAKLIIEALKSPKSDKPASYISEDDKKRIDVCLKDNPEFSSPDDIALLTDLPLQTVTLYLLNKLLDDKQKNDAMEKKKKKAIFIGAAITGGVIAGALVAPFILPAIGFTAASVAAGSVAAAIQRPAVVAGSAFVIAQSVGATVTAPLILPAIGFTAAGVTAGSIAAAIQGPAVVAGSAFAITQSVGATVTVAGAMAVGAAAVGVVGAAAGGTAGVVTGAVVAEKKTENEG